MLLDLYKQKRHPRLGSAASVAGGSRGKRATIPAPTGGINAKDALSAMGKADAIMLENLIVTPSGIMTRPGSAVHVSGLSGNYVESLMTYAPASGLGKMFAGLPTAIYDVTAAGAGSSAVTSMSNGRWQWTNFATIAGDYLYCVNGEDDPHHYDGTAWAVPSITGTRPDSTALDPTTFISVTPHMNRLWFVENETRVAWYLDVQAIAGTAQPFDMSSLTKLGGHLIAIDTWTRDGGTGSDDFGVFVFSTGEVLVYAGTDPGSDTTWALQGIYKIPEPIGRRCTYKLGAELLILTTQGPLPMSRVSGLSQASQTNLAITDKISGNFNVASQRASTLFGWEIVEDPRRNLLIVNVPETERLSQMQYVFSERKGAWTSFRSWNAACFTLYQGNLYFGDSSGIVWKVTSDGDNGKPILQTYMHAFGDLGTSLSKCVKMARPRIVGPPGFTPAVQIKTDLDTSPPSSVVMLAPASGPDWDAVDWDTVEWGQESGSSQEWQVVEGIGSTVSVAFRWSSTTPVMLQGTDILYETGGLL